MKPDFDKVRASFQAKHLHALEPLIRAGQGRADRFSISGLIIEPVATGGAILVSTDGGSLAAIFDPNAYATRPVRITVSDDLFTAVTPPPGIKMIAPGQPFTVALPEWAHPGQVLATGIGAYVTGQMPHPGFEEDDSVILASVSAEEGNVYEGGYRIHKDSPKVNWRGALAKPRTGDVGRINLYPHVLARFERLEALFGKGMEMSFGGSLEAVILSSPGAPFIGAVMPNRFAIEAASLPAWATLPDVPDDGDIASAA